MCTACLGFFNVHCLPRIFFRSVLRCSINGHEEFITVKVFREFVWSRRHEISTAEVCPNSHRSRIISTICSWDLGFSWVGIDGHSFGVLAHDIDVVHYDKLWFVSGLYVSAGCVCMKMYTLWFAVQCWLGTPSLCSSCCYENAREFVLTNFTKVSATVALFYSPGSFTII